MFLSLKTFSNLIFLVRRLVTRNPSYYYHLDNNITHITTENELDSDEAKNDPFLGGHLSPNPNLFDQILP